MQVPQQVRHTFYPTRPKPPGPIRKSVRCYSPKLQSTCGFPFTRLPVYGFRGRLAHRPAVFCSRNLIQPTGPGRLPASADGVFPGCGFCRYRANSARARRRIPIEHLRIHSRGIGKPRRRTHHYYRRASGGPQERSRIAVAARCRGSVAGSKLPWRDFRDRRGQSVCFIVLQAARLSRCQDHSPLLFRRR